MKIYNTITKKKEIFTPITPGQIKMYTCGQTVYNDIHVGNARFYVVFDAIRRYLKYKGYAVSYVQNFTDIDDKLIQRAKDENTTVETLAEKYIAHTKEDLANLNVMPVTVNPQATKEIAEIIGMISELTISGNAYEKNGSVYFNTKTAPGYGKLSRKNIDDLIAGARVEVSHEKQNPTDFILWKPAKPGEPQWPSPWGNGRPGWHIECSAMVRKYLGEEIDIHGGGSDLIFPHHENEIAQSEAANNCNYARYWMHSGILTVNHKKMSKSLGNFETLRQLAMRFSYDVVRFYFVSGHYRMPMEFTDEVLEAALQGLKRIGNCYHNLAHAAKHARDGAVSSAFMQSCDMYVTAFLQAMDDDFNTADAITAVYELVGFANKGISGFTKGEAIYVREKLEFMCADILGVKLPPVLTIHAKADLVTQTTMSAVATVTNSSNTEDTLSDTEVDELIAARQTARQNKDFAKSDQIRDELTARGIILEDTPQGARWRRA